MPATGYKEATALPHLLHATSPESAHGIITSVVFTIRIKESSLLYLNWDLSKCCTEGRAANAMWLLPDLFSVMLLTALFEKYFNYEM